MKYLDASIVIGQGTSDVQVHVSRAVNVLLGKVTFEFVLIESGEWHYPISTNEEIEFLGRPGEFLYMVDLSVQLVLKPPLERISQLSHSLSDCFYNNLHFRVNENRKTKDRLIGELWRGQTIFQG